jgi:hypothetical protein
MKMICPHCGVKGSADDALLGRKVECPKCNDVFEVEAEVIEAIEVGDLDLEQLPDQADEQFDTASEEEIDDVFSKLLAGDTEEDTAQGEIDGVLGRGEGNEGHDDVVAALSPSQNDSLAGSELLGEEEQDETLTIIEDFPEEVMLDSDDVPSSEWEDEEELTAALDGIDEEEQDEEHLKADAAEDAEGIEKEEETIDFEDGFLDDESGDQQAPQLEEETDTDDDLPEELFADEPELETSADDEPELFDDASSAEDSAEEQEISIDEDDIPDNDNNILSASFLDDNLDELEQDEDDSSETAAVQKCSACDQYVDPENKFESGGNVYCSKCIPADAENTKSEDELSGDGESAFPALSKKAELNKAEAAAEPADGAVGRFTVTTLIKDAWHYSKGVKGAIWAGIAVMYIVLFALAFVIFYLNLAILPGLDPLSAGLVDGGVQALISLFSFVFSAGILMIAVNRVGHQYFSWKMVFSGFKRLGAMIVLVLLQTIMLVIGFCLFILPGIYLSVGYILAIPLLFVKGLSPWQALETSRQAIHKRWWTVFFTLIVMSIIVSISTIPLGLGLIWTVPMFAVMIGVLFYHLCGADEEEEAFE